MAETVGDRAAILEERRKPVGTIAAPFPSAFRPFTARRLCAVWALCAAVVTTPAVHADPLSDSDIKRLAAIWRSEKNDIITAKIKVKAYRLTIDETAKLGNEGIDHAVSLLQKGDVSEFILAVKNVIPATDLDQLVYFGNTIEIVQHAAKLTNRSQKRNSSGAREIALYNGSEEIRLHTDNKQADLYTGNSFIELFNLEQLWRSPAIAEESLKKLPTAKNNGTFSIKGTACSIYGDLATGFVYKEECYDKHGVIVSKRHQFRNIEPNSFPAGTVEIDYSRGTPVLFTYYHFLECTVNEEIPPDTFHVTVPTGYKVVDHRTNANSPLVTTNDGAPVDALQYSPQTRSNTPRPPTYSLELSATAAALFLLLLATLFWRRWRGHRQQPPA